MKEKSLEDVPSYNKGFQRLGTGCDYGLQDGGEVLCGIEG